MISLTRQQKIVHACMRLRDRLPAAAVDARTTAGNRLGPAVVKSWSGPLTTAGLEGELYDVPPLPRGFVMRDEPSCRSDPSTTDSHSSLVGARAGSNRVLSGCGPVLVTV
jgi:hypothetical protein